MFKGFRQFILKGNVVDLAVGIVIGASFSALVNAMVRDFITPLISIIGGKPNFSTWEFTIRGSHFMYGDFFNSVLSFLINAAVIYYFIVVPVARFVSASNASKDTPDPTTKKCPYCFSEVAIEASRCAFCTSELTETKAKKEA